MTPTLDPAVTHPSKQQVFNAAVTHAARMPETSTNPGANGKCVYRAEDGSNACFIGGMLTDDEARVMDASDGVAGGTGLANLLDYGTDLVPARFRHWELRHLLVGLQGVHDSHLGRECWPGMLRRLGEAHGLNTSIIDGTFARAE